MEPVPSERAGNRRAAVVFNPTKVNESDLRRAVALAEAEGGWAETLWLETSPDDPGTGQAREAVQQDADLVIAAGGDGTVRAAAEGLRGTGVALGLVPAGTGNLLARNLGLDLTSLDRAVRDAFSGNDRAIDLGIADIERPDGKRSTLVFVVLCGVGIDAAMIANTDEGMKRRVGWPAYVQGIARSVRRGHRIRLRYRYDNGPARTTHANSVMVGNCGSLPGGVALLPDAVIDDGLLDVVMLRPSGIRGWLQIATRILIHNRFHRAPGPTPRFILDSKPVRALRYETAASVVLRVDEPEEFEVDGDEAGLIVAARIRVAPGALNVRVPAEPGEPSAGR